jgi:hypothetical protein
VEPETGVLPTPGWLHTSVEKRYYKEIKRPYTKGGSEKFFSSLQSDFKNRCVDVRKITGFAKNIILVITSYKPVNNDMISLTNIAKTEGRVSNLFVNFAEVHPIFYKYRKNPDTETGMTTRPDPQTMQPV